jgi:hypothetical protein
LLKTIDFQEETKPISIDLDQFNDITINDKYWNYLLSRKFDPDTLANLISYFRLKGGVGDWNNRLIIPFIINGAPVSWTGRAINKSFLRYKDLKKDLSIFPPKQIVFNQDVDDGRILCILEGQFDVMKIDFYGKKFGIRAVGLNTKTLSSKQELALLELKQKFIKTFLILDNDSFSTEIESITLASKLEIEHLTVPFGYKDFGEMPVGRVLKFCSTL